MGSYIIGPPWPGTSHLHVICQSKGRCWHSKRCCTNYTLVGVGVWHFFFGGVGLLLTSKFSGGGGVTLAQNRRPKFGFVIVQQEVERFHLPSFVRASEFWVVVSLAWAFLDPPRPI